MTNRETFEKWYKDVYWDYDYKSNRYTNSIPTVRFDEDTNRYNHLDVDLAWNAWNAALEAYKICA